jgi:hypothetical protein
MSNKTVYRHKSKSKRGGKTKRSYSSHNKYSHEEIVLIFLQMLNTIKLYHWKTMSYATHEATDDLYVSLGTNIDLFVETMLGKKGERVNLTNVKHLPLMDYTNISDFKAEIQKYKKYMVDMNDSKTINLNGNSDLLNIRDTILGDLNKFTYLLTFK